MQDRIGWQDLRLVLAIGAEGTLTGAARTLGIDHSTAFRRLGALEARLGVRLFDRARDGYAPTPAGEAAIASAVRMDGELAELERRLAGEDLRPSGSVRITTTDTLVDVLAPVFAAFRDAFPDIVLEVVVTNAFLTLTRRDADVAIRPTRRPPDHLVGRRTVAIATAVYGAPGRGDPDRPAWIGADDSLAHLGSAQWMRANVPDGGVVLRSNTLMGMLAAARAGIGIAALPCFLADPDPGLRRVMPILPELETELWLLTHPDLKRVARIRALLDFAAERIAERRALFEGRPSGPGR